MKPSDALAIVIAKASAWGENVEEGFARRVDAYAEEGEVLAIAAASNVEAEDVREVRDLWQAIDLLTKQI